MKTSKPLKKDCQVQPRVGQRSLSECEAIIDAAVETFREVAMALWEIKNRQLWRQSGHASFADYCAARHGWAKTYGYDMANCGKVLAALPDSAIAEKVTSESVARELAKVPPEERAEVLERVSANGKVTAKSIRAAVAPAQAESEREERPRVKTADEELSAGGGVESRHAGVDIENRNNPPPKHPLSGKAEAQDTANNCSRESSASPACTDPNPDDAKHAIMKVAIDKWITKRLEGYEVDEIPYARMFIRQHVCKGCPNAVKPN